MPVSGDSAKSDRRRQAVVEAAVACFARKGFYGATTQEIAERAGISQPYIYRLFPDKASLFASTVDFVSDLMAGALTTTLSDAAAAAGTPKTALRAARDAYRDFAVQGDIMRFLMQANCAGDEPAIRSAVQRCYAKQVTVVAPYIRSEELVRRWFGEGMLMNVATSLGLGGIDEPWARTLRAGSRPRGAQEVRHE